jgi:hypothetical protein
MPIETGIYCQHCADERGKLQPFEERFERMIQWTLKSRPSITREEAEGQTLDYMPTMPAWRDHPTLKERRAASRQ